MEFKKNLISSSIALALIGTSAQTWAQEPTSANTANNEVIEEIVISGIRGSLKRSMDLKRDAAGVVDGISSEDIGKFPDSNLAESLQRITGVTIDRKNGEGSKVTVRGFGPSFNLVTLNGRQMPTASIENGQETGRSFDFGNLASEGVSAIEVYKSGKANVPTGGIGSTINIKTIRPLEAPGRVATVGIKGVHDTSTDDGDSMTPEVSGLYSDTFADDTIGIALSGSYQDLNNGVNTASVGGWRTFSGDVECCDWGSATPQTWGGIPQNAAQVNRPGASDIYSVPQTIGYELAEFERTRTNGQLTVQWEPIDSITATLDYTYSEMTSKRKYSNYSAWFNFDAQESEWTDGPIASPLVYTENLGGSDLSMASSTDAVRNENTSVGFNLEWRTNENLTLALDYHDSDAESKPDSRNGNSSQLAIASYTRDRTTGYFDSELPVLQLGLSGPLRKDDMVVTGSVFENKIGVMDIEQLKLSGTYEFDWDNGVESIDFGIQTTEVSNRSASATVQRDSWSAQTPLGAISDLLTATSSAGDFDDISGGSDDRRHTDYFTFDIDDLIARVESLQNSGDAPMSVANDLGDCGTGFCPSSNFSTDRRTQEDAIAAYFQVHFSYEIQGMPVNTHFGVRYEDTDVDSQALVPTYAGVEWYGGNEFTAVTGRDANGATLQDFSKLSGSYDNWLPNLDFDIGLTDDIVFRASYSKSMARPDYADIQGGVTIVNPIRTNGGNGARGNPALIPFESTNFDLSLEYYYGESSYASIGFFRKDVENYIGTSFVDEPLFGLAHPANGPLFQEAIAATGSSDSGTLFNYMLANFAGEPGVDAVNGVITGVAGRDGPTNFNVTVPVNTEDAVMDGWEVVLQHNFDETGFGIIVNATLVDADVGYDDNSLAEQFVLEGLGDSANFVGFYDKDGIQVRAAYSWRDDFLAGTGQANVGLGPTYVAEYGQWDFNASYEYNENITVFVEGINITDESRHVYGRDEKQTLFASQGGARYNVGFRYTFD